jgi:hypothetical protein
MADYYPLIRKAIDRLEKPSEAARYNVYERARQALVHQLRGAGIVDASLDQHLEALDRAVAQIEREFASARPGPTHVPRAVREEPPVQAQEAPQPVQAQAVPPPRSDEEQPTPVSSPEERSASVLRRWGVAMAAGVLAVVIAAGLSFYHFQPRPRPAAADRPAPAPARSAPAQTAVASADDTAPPSYILRRQRVFYRTTHPPGTIAVSLSQKFLYLVQPNQVAIRYTIGVGSECDKVAGLFHVTEKVPRQRPCCRISISTHPRFISTAGARSMKRAIPRPSGKPCAPVACNPGSRISPTCSIEFRSTTGWWWRIRS